MPDYVGAYKLESAMAAVPSVVRPRNLGNCDTLINLQGISPKRLTHTLKYGTDYERFPCLLLILRGQMSEEELRIKK